ncbi:AgmX/PglI C-terminal domain-containing protein [Pseudoalteromonas sp. G4]|uniref:AgmX/PglI C-terminal domain-containing protein n=1 Tax=Pseudoalteromonas sp. G4 TaxID=2992761 RepID=UPI00237ED319|nr:AgmX/PglI C-terminal domain-containing protein [Pseudoalteromonas sp. G4]MDE3272505.1 AgmX/PglI C-terminal domain-containing protein [Pseudoalteromonas sp. G4]
MTTAVLNANFELYDNAGNRLFSRLTSAFLVGTLLFAAVVKLTELPELTPAQKTKIPPSLTRVIERVKVEPKPEKPKPEIKQEQPKPEPEKKPQPEIKTEVKVKTPNKKALEKAKEEASRAGLVALADDLAALRDDFDLAGLVALADDLAALRDDFDLTPTTQPLKTKKPTPKVTSVEEVTAKADTSKQITVKDGAQASANVQALADKSLIALGDEVVAEQGGYQSDMSEGEVVSEETLEMRKVEAIRAVLDKNQGAFYTLYRRALRKNPSLQGKVTVEIVVAGNGQVKTCEILSSDLNDAELERKLVNRIRMINFGQELVSETKLNYSFNFLPF